MKHIFVGDLHGRDVWNVIKVEDYDKIVFLGDYVDSFTISNSDIISNMLQLIFLKKAYPDKVVLLWGNHDAQYYDLMMGYCAGYRPTYASALNILFRDNVKLFDVAYQHGDLLASHAGVCGLWYDSVYLPSISPRYPSDMTVAEVLNDQFYDKRYRVFDIGKSSGGSDIVGGPLWARYRDYTYLPPEDVIRTQVVGHTEVENIERHLGGRLINVDCNWNCENKEGMFLEMDL